MLKRKLLSLLLVIVLIATSVSVVFPTIMAADSNLFKNGDFAQYSDNMPNGWTVKSNASYSPTIVSNDGSDGLPTTDATNYLKFTRNTTGTGDLVLYNEDTIEIEKNATYTISFWVKDKNVPGLKFFLYEPDYIDRNDAEKHNDYPAEGQNVYTYDYDNGSTTNVQRTDISHTIAIANSGTTLSTSNSMAQAKTKIGGVDTSVVLTPDFPAETNSDTWVKIVHTFTTGNNDEHTAKVRYGIVSANKDGQGNVTDGEFAVGGFVATVAYNDIPVYQNNFEGITAGTKLVYFESGEKLGTDTTNYDVDSTGGLSWQELSISSSYKHNGKTSLRVYTRYSLGGMHISGLSKNTNYKLSLWAYMTSKTGANTVVAHILKRTDHPIVENPNGSKSNKAASLAIASSTACNADGVWTEIPVTFTTGDYTDISLWFNFSGDDSNELFVDDVAIYEIPTPLDALEDGVILDGNGEVLSNSNDYLGYTYTVNGDSADVIYSGDTVVATAEYDETSPAYNFLGWYKNGTELVDNGAKTITFTAESGVSYTPKMRSKNLLTNAGGYENYAADADLQVPSADRTSYPAMGLWGANKNAGYYGTQPNENLLCADGTTVTRQSTWDSCTLAGCPYHSAGTFSECTATFTVAEEGGVNSSNALKINTGAWVLDMGLGTLEKNTDYVVNFKYKLSGSYIKHAAIVSDLGVHRLGDGESRNFITALTFEQVSLKNNTATDTWYEVTLEFNSGDFDQNAYLVLPPPDGASNHDIYIDNLTLSKKSSEVTVFENGIVVDEGNNTVSNSNDYLGYEFTVNGAASETVVAGNTVVATAKYDTNTSAYNFLGWYKNGTELVDNGATTITFTAESGVTYTPKLQTKNMLTKAGGYEDYEVGTDLKHTDRTTSTYASNGLWGANANAGYGKTTLAETIYDNTGASYQQVANNGTYNNGLEEVKVSDAYSHTGSKSLHLSIGAWVTSTAFENVEPGKTYDFSFWVMKDPTNETATQLKNLAVVTTLNVGNATCPEDNTSLKGNVGNLFKSLGLKLATGNNSIAAVTLPDETWVQVTSSFTVPANTELNTVYLAISNSDATTGNASKFYIDDLTLCAQSTSTEVFEDGVVMDEDNNVIANANDYIGYTYTVNGNTASEINVGDTVVATADYNSDYGTVYEFLGWYKNGTELVDNGAKTITFTAEKGVTYTPKLLSRNLLTAVGGYENYADGTNLEIAATDRTTYPAEGLWGANKNHGYYGAQPNENILCADGSTVTRQSTWDECAVPDCPYHSAGTTGSGSFTFTVVEGAGLSGSNALKLNVTSWTLDMGLGALEQNTVYTLRFKYKLSGSYIKHAAVVSDLGVHRLSDGNTTSNSPQVKKITFTQVNLKNNTTADTWYDVEMEINSGAFNQNAYLVLASPDGASRHDIYLDDVVLYKSIPKVVVTVNNSDLGSAKCEPEQAQEGDTVTFVATPTAIGEFVGWYIGDQCVSTELSYQATYDSANVPVAHFEPTLTSANVDYGYENVANGDKLAYASSGLILGIDTANHTMASQYGLSWQELVVSSAQKHSGNNSLRISTSYSLAGRHITGLAKNTGYEISYWMYTENSGTNNVVGHVLKKSDAPINEANKMVISSLAYVSSEVVNANNEWKKVVLRFNTGDETDFTLWWQYSAIDAGKQAYIDDIVVRDLNDVIIVPVNNEVLGTAECDPDIADNGTTVTFIATPKDGAKFVGWYVGDQKVSDDANYVTALDKSNLPTAHFETYGSSANIDYGYENGASDEKLAYASGGYILGTDTATHLLASQHSLTWQSLQVSTAQKHSGEKSLKLNTSYSFGGRRIYGLEKETTYGITYWVYTENSAVNTVTGYVLSSTDLPVNENNKEVISLVALGQTDTVNANNQWKKVFAIFNTGDNTEVDLWWQYVAADAGKTAYVDDIEVFKAVKVEVTAKPGGSVATSESGAVELGTTITATATPNEGNTFVGWFDASGNKVSDKPVYTFAANQNVSISANFEGYNMPPRNILEEQGMDGTFENGTIEGWFYYHETDSTSWCSTKVSTDVAYQGEKSLRILSRYRYTFLPLTGLNKNTDYKFEFYMYFDETDEYARIAPFGIIGENDVTTFGEATTVYAKTEANIYGGGGWQKVQFYFNTGDATAANFYFEYYTGNSAGEVFVDNMFLTEYVPNEELINGDMSNGRENWIGTASVESVSGNKALKLTEGNVAYQPIKLNKDLPYTVKFRAKGNVMAAASHVNATTPTYKNLINSESYIEISGDWKEYEFTFLSGNNSGANLLFKSLSGDAYVDDIVITVGTDAQGHNIEKVDFETDRFDIINSDTSVWEIYKSTGANDTNVLNGEYSLRFKYDENRETEVHEFLEAYLSNHITTGLSYKVTISYKFDNGRSGGAVTLQPDVWGKMGLDFGYEYSADNGWQTATFMFSVGTFPFVKSYISTLAGGTIGDIYFDDITLTAAPPVVIESNSTVKYCEEFYNDIDNGNFEETVTADSIWSNLPSNFKIVEDKSGALKGSHFLRVTAGEKVILPVEVKTLKEYYFGASVKGDANTEGYIAVANSISPAITYFSDYYDQPASFVYVDSTKEGYVRNAFKFSTDTSGYVYLVIECTSGTMDLDSLMLFTSDYGYRYDPNDYTAYVDYDYDNLTSSTCVINGGFGEQPYANVADDENTGTAENISGEAETDLNGTENAEDTESPTTGDTATLPIFVLIATLVSAFALVLLKGRKEGVKADEK